MWRGGASAANVVIEVSVTDAVRGATEAEATTAKVGVEVEVEVTTTDGAGVGAEAMIVAIGDGRAVLGRRVSGAARVERGVRRGVDRGAEQEVEDESNEARRIHVSTHHLHVYKVNTIIPKRPISYTPTTFSLPWL